jgi:Tfp pilus assembly protein PilF
MRKLNGKLFLGLVLVAALCTGTVFGIHHFQYQRIAQSLLWQAQHAADQGQVDRQARYLAHYIELNPSDEVEKAHLACLWAGDSFAAFPKTRLRAVRLLDDVLTRSTDDHPELRRVLVRLALELNMLQLARGHLEKLLSWEQMQKQISQAKPDADGKVDAERGELEGFWGQLLERENKQPADAVPCYRLAIRHAPQLLTSYTRLAYLLRRLETTSASERQDHEHEAKDQINALVNNNPQVYQSYLSRWHYYRDLGLIALAGEKDGDREDLAKVGEDVTQALQRAPEDTAVLLAAADRERLLGHTAENNARVSADEREALVVQHGKKAYDYLQQGLALQAKAQVANDTILFQLLWHKANLLLDELRRKEGKLEEGKLSRQEQEHLEERQTEVVQAIEQIRKTRGLPATADYLRGRLLVHQRQWAEAAALFEHVRPVLSSQPELANEINIYLGRCYEQLEEPGRMYEAYKRAAERDPQRISLVSEMGMAKAEWDMGQLDQAAARYDRMIRNGQLPDTLWPDVVRLEIQRQVQQDQPSWGRAEKALEQAARQLPTSVDVVLLQTQLELARSQPAAAEKVLEDASRLKKYAASAIEIRTALAMLALRQEKPDLKKARKVLDAAEADLGDSVSLRLALARYHAIAKSDKEDITALAAGSERFSETDQGKLLGGLADTLLSAGHAAEARKLWQQVIGLPRRQTDLTLRLVLFDLAMKDGDEAGMTAALADIEKVEGRTGAYHPYGQALYKLWQVKKNRLSADERSSLVQEARSALDQALAQRSSWPAIYLARAEIDLLEGNPDQAINNLREACNHGEKNPLVVRQLAELLARNGRFKEAATEMSRLRRSLLAQSDIGRLATAIAVHQPQADLQQAEQMIRNAVKSDSKDARELIWMGLMLAEVKKPREAERKLRQALALKPREPDGYIALIQLLSRQNRMQDANEVLKQAERQLPADKKAMALGQCLELLGKRDKARLQYQAALSGQPKDAATLRRVAAFHIEAGQYREAEPLLRILYEGKADAASPTDQAWARRYLAVALANSNDFSRFREALRLVGLKLDVQGKLAGEDSSAGGVEEQRFQAHVLAAQQNNRHFRKRALELLEKLSLERALQPDDSFLMGLLYDADGNWAQARPILADLVKHDPPEPRYIAHYVQALLTHNLPDPAEKLIDQLEELEDQRHVERNVYASLELRARLMEARGEGDAAVAKLKKHIARPNADPDEILIVLASLTRQKKYARAFDMGLQAWERKDRACRPEVLGGVCVALMRAMNPRPDVSLVQRVEEKLKEALAQKPSSVVLLLHLADLQDMRDRYEEAEKAYRDVLRVEPNNVVALNNLAWLLVQSSGDAGEAMQHIEAAVNGMGRRADLLDTRGLVHLALGDVTAALTDLKEANADTPTPTRLYHLARAHLQTQDRTAAYRVLQEARDRGLTVNSLHPIEQQACGKLLDELKLSREGGATRKE